MGELAARLVQRYCLLKQLPRSAAAPDILADAGLNLRSGVLQDTEHGFLTDHAPVAAISDRATHGPQRPRGHRQG